MRRLRGSRAPTGAALLLLLACACLAEEHGTAPVPAGAPEPLDAREAVEEPGEPGAAPAGAPELSDARAAAEETGEPGEASRKNIWGLAALRGLVVVRRPPKRMVAHRSVRRVVRRVVRKMPPHHKHKDTQHYIGAQAHFHHEGQKDVFVLLAFVLGMIGLFTCFYCLESAHMDDSRYSSYSAMNQLDATANAHDPSSWRHDARIRGGLFGFGKSKKKVEESGNVLTTWLQLLRGLVPTMGSCTSGCRPEGARKPRSSREARTSEVELVT